jgi:hypothetical protein
MKEPVMNREKRGYKDLCFLKIRDRTGQNSFNRSDPDYIKEADDDILHPVNQHHLRQAPMLY